MDVKLPNTQIAITVPAPYQRAITSLQQAYLPSSPVSPDDIFDCVELQSVKTSPVNKQIITYRPSDSPQIKKKGQIIDTWI
jgi:hypothetical protein